MRNIIFTYIILAALLLASCYEDIGNYDYNELEEISIEGLNSSYSGVAMVDTLSIKPIVSSNLPNAEFEYFWYMYRTSQEGELEEDTIAYTKDLNYFISQSYPSWRLVFGAKNINTGMTKLVSSSLNIGTEFTTAWYILKDDGAYSDLDMLKVTDTIVPTSIVENVYSLINGEKLEGKAKLLNYFSSYRTAANPGEMAFVRNKALVTMSENDLSFVNINNLEELRGFEDAFIGGEPAVRKLGFAGYRNASYTLINDGELYYINNTFMPGTIGSMYGSPLGRNANFDEYSLSDYTLTGSNYNVYFDNISSSFVYYGGATSVLSDITIIPQGGSLLNKELIYMGMIKDSRGIDAVGLMRDKSDAGLINLFRLKSVSDNLAIISNQGTITSGMKLFDATKITTSQESAIIYFAVGNELYSRNLVTGVETLQYSAPAGEEITMVRSRRYDNSTEPQFKYDYIIVGTSNGANYKVHFFSKTSASLNADPEFTFEGEGQAKDAIFISPRVSEATYMQGY
ncbi:MAG: PKD-like family lipoprotein [Bacteroidales bacterium]